MHDIRALDSHTLFAASDWMRRIAKALVHDDDRADDLVQEAWQAALRNPPPAALRPWLGGILRRKAKEAHRANANRRAREERAALPERQASTADLAACAEEQRYLIDCVLALPPKYREVVLLRFYEDLPPRAVAERLALPVNTVRTQTQRALERLRERLDDRHDGDRRAWGMALLPLASESTPSLGLPSDAPPPTLLHSLTTTWRWAGLLAVFASAVMFATVAGRGRPDHPSGTSSAASLDREVRATDRLFQPTSDPSTLGTSPRQLLSRLDEVRTGWNILGELRDETTKAPVAAFVQLDEGAPILSAQETGAFELSSITSRTRFESFIPSTNPRSSLSKT
ncbi:MAG: sigma-70 family RNA polymerase sigma factor [Planctomycetota bacterium]